MTQTEFYTQAVSIKIKAKDQDLLPVYATKGAAGADIKAYLKEPVTIAPQTAVLIPTGLFMEIPPGFEVQIRPRSGLALKNLISVLNSPGTIDSDYRGELQIILMNHSQVPFVVTHGMRIAQMVIAACLQATFEVAPELSATDRAQGGFGSTGTH